ncbi:helix-turn-helix transcriptional regulator [Streptacidiphilus rugosus]|uniref:helix-turn-helix transcriptional regulator n=1 Tax=Streptacidiphilus rugosus TaxID=405783 RepID=UPI000559E2C1|nr:LuxR C-terminal-related transcriptional regulator [Streptacidiphilus rugosus]
MYDPQQPSTPPAAAPGLPNGDPVLLTRLHAPGPMTAFVRRDRLVRRLDEAVRLPVTLVNGPAGAGKTMLVADWLTCGRIPGPTAWLTLETGDNLPGNFWAYVREALFRAAPDDLPADVGVPAQAEHVEPSLLVRLAAWINSRPEPFVLVLDECEQLNNPDLTGQLHDLIRHTEEHLRLVLISRNEPLLPLHRYRAAGLLTEIRTADLALRLPEATEVLARHGLRPSPATVEAVNRKLTGWTAGLRLLALAARDVDDVDTCLKRIETEQAALSDFLLAEVLKVQPHESQDLLLRCSILGLVHPDLADALTGRRDGRRILTELHQTNAFTEALPDDWYRLHPMFASILRLHLSATAPDQVEALHERAARWLAAHERHRTALDHAAAGGAWDFAAQIVVDQLALGELFTGREVGRLRDLFSRMPASARSPAAELVRAALHLTADDVETAVTVLDRVAPALPPEEAGPQLAAALLHAEAGRLLGSAEIADSAARRAHGLERSAPPSRLAEHPELLTHVDVDLASALLAEGRLEEAGQALDAAAQAPVSTATALLRHDSLCRLALIDYLRGWPGRAEQRVRRADQEAESASLPADSRFGVGDLVLAAAALEREEVGVAQEALTRLETAQESRSDPVVALGRGVVRADLHVVQGNPEAALELLEETRRHELAGHPSAWGRERLAITAAAAHLAAGHPEAALEVLAEVQDGGPGTIVAAARARLVAGRTDGRTVEQLQALRDDPEVGTAPRTRALLLLAQTSSAHGDDDSTRLLRQAIATAQPERLRRPFRECASWVRPQLRRHPQLAQSHLWLPGDLRPPGPDGVTDGAADAAVEALTERELSVLACAARMMSTQEIAEDLFLSPNTVKTHLKSINRKLATSSRREAVRKAARLHLLDDL